MPEFSPFLLLILFFGVSWVLRRIKLIKTMTESQTRRAAQSPVPPPASFMEAAPVTPRQPVQTSRAQGTQVSKPGGLLSKAPEFEARSYQEGLRVEPVWGEAMDEKYQPAKAAAPRKPRSPIIPQFTGSSVVQAIVTKEILTRPRSAKRLGHS
jgi:hypothetical protein